MHRSLSELEKTRELLNILKFEFHQDNNSSNDGKPKDDFEQVLKLRRMNLESVKTVLEVCFIYYCCYYYY